MGNPKMGFLHNADSSKLSELGYTAMLLHSAGLFLYTILSMLHCKLTITALCVLYMTRICIAVSSIALQCIVLPLDGLCLLSGKVTPDNGERLAGLNQLSEKRKRSSGRNKTIWSVLNHDPPLGQGGGRSVGG